VQGHDRAHDGQPQAGATFGAGAAAVDTVEALEQVRQVLRFDPRARIAYRYRRVVAIGLHQQRNMCARWAVTDGIGQQVGEGALDHQAVT